MRVFHEKVMERLQKDYPMIPEQALNYLVRVSPLRRQVFRHEIRTENFEEQRPQYIEVGEKVFLDVPEAARERLRAHGIPVPHVLILREFPEGALIFTTGPTPLFLELWAQGVELPADDGIYWKMEG